MIFLKLFWKQIGLAVIVAGTIYYIYELKDDLALSVANLATVVAEKKTLQTNLDFQNSAILKLSEDAKKQSERAKKAEANYKLLQAKYKKTLEGIDNVTYDPNFDDCTNTRNLLNRVPN